MKKGLLSVLCGALLVGSLFFTEQQFSESAGKGAHPGVSNHNEQF
ncbi:hypothetical protein [Virgibacillus chiguensis]|uniref:Phr family secreted Rap phosphatase inhibitor n=1 Tax=Virgibacillus chiguensis TaxID=411959 RepID=A0A1M5WHV9_9BACI|nr:hypothetical protein [Virgibacillus chiguensis]SHH86997.1 hypothetical protein SAMN05421807_11667 [Virgibacillus chiguensis]